MYCSSFQKIIVPIHIDYLVLIVVCIFILCKRQSLEFIVLCHGWDDITLRENSCSSPSYHFLVHFLLQHNDFFYRNWSGALNLYLHNNAVVSFKENDSMASQSISSGLCCDIYKSPFNRLIMLRIEGPSCIFPRLSNHLKRPI